MDLKINALGTTTLMWLKRQIIPYIKQLELIKWGHDENNV